ncbi:MAG: hypothetical protein R2911_04390 [Caldilineaceae bacterium]
MPSGNWMITSHISEHPAQMRTEGGVRLIFASFGILRKELQTELRPRGNWGHVGV